MTEAFGLGYAPDQWTALAGRAGDAGFRPEVLEKGGLLLRGTTRPGFYDRFRNRLTFPIRDTMGRVIAFGARTLDGSEPKYLNSPETEIFHKGRTLFGLDRLRAHPRSAPVLVMEGYTDVLMSVQVGVRGAVATLGTSMTPEHARILSRYSDRIVLVYDGDPPGLIAAERGAMILLRAGHLDIKVAVLPDGQDPCDFFKARGEAGMEDLFDVTTDLVTFLLDRTAGHHDLGSLEGRRRAAEDLLRTAAAVSDPVTRELVLGRLSERLRLPVPALRERALALREAGREAEIRPGGRQGGRKPVGAPGQAQLWIVQAFINEPRLLRDSPVQDLAVIPDARVRRLLETLHSLGGDPSSGEVPAPGRLLDLIEDGELRGLARRALLEPGHGLPLRTRLEEALTYLKNRCRRQEVESLKSRVEDGDTGLLRDLQNRYRLIKGGGPARTAPTLEAGLELPDGTGA
jgi:DNA primase